MPDHPPAASPVGGDWCKAKWTLPHPEGLSGKRISAPHWVDLPLRLMYRLALVVLPTLLGKLDLEDLDEETVNRLVGITWTISERVVTLTPVCNCSELVRRIDQKWLKKYSASVFRLC